MCCTGRSKSVAVLKDEAATESIVSIARRLLAEEKNILQSNVQARNGATSEEHMRSP